MKKFVSILLLLVYGLSSSGMTIQFHYCCGKLKDVKLSPVTEKQCGMKHSSSKKCCDDKQVDLKIKGDQKTAYSTLLEIPSAIAVKPITPAFLLQPLVSKTIVPEVFAPPPRQNELYIFNCVYRI